MNKKPIIILILVCIIFLSGCSSRLPLENGALILLIGVDKGTKENLIVGTSMTLFKVKSKKSSFEEIVEAPSVYSAFSKINTKTPGYLTSSKVQIVLVGKELSRQSEWLNKLDPIYRDPLSSSNLKLIITDSPIIDFFNIKPPDGMSIPMYIYDVYKSSLGDNMIVPSYIQELMRQKDEEGMTQTIPIIKKIKNKVQTKGIAFFDQKGKYVTSLAVNKVPIYCLLRNPKLKGRMVLNIPLKNSRNNQLRIVSVLVENVKKNIDVEFRENRFRFVIKLNMEVSIVERTNTPPITSNKLERKEIKHLERQLTDAINKELNKIIKEIQNNKIDPLGFSMYARAYQYREWKLRKENWGNTISNSNIEIKPILKIQNTGIIRG